MEFNDAFVSDRLGMHRREMIRRADLLVKLCQLNANAERHMVECTSNDCLERMAWLRVKIAEMKLETGLW